jgi:predicted acylesterase/phospholipase RssA
MHDTLDCAQWRVDRGDLMMKLLPLITLPLCLSGCATTATFTAETEMCKFRPQRLIVDDPLFPGRSALATALAESEPEDSDSADDNRLEIPDTTLVLSGGNQNGAFGAGFLKQWGELSPGGKLPQFGLVTGISTGAILATWAFIGEPEVPAREYLIAKESDVLKVFSKPSKDGKLGLGAAFGLLRRNTLADLDPLRQRLRALIDHRTLSEVANRSGRLLVGAVEVDTGDMYIFDMKKMAVRATEHAEDTTEFRKFRDCYVEAIMASSSAPIGAKPVFIDNRMFIDGGARFGVFVDYLDPYRQARYRPSAVIAPGDPADLPSAPKLFILMNGTQWVSPNCSKQDSTKCRDSYLYPDRVNRTAGQHRDWDIASLAFRSNDILTNQVYRLSAARVETQYREAYPSLRYRQRYYFARMHRGDLNRAEKFTLTIAGQTKTCIGWLKHDKETIRPLQFHPNYMACISAYGAQEARRVEWHQPGIVSQFDSAVSAD